VSDVNLLPSVIHAEYCDKFRIRLTFNDGTTEAVDFSPWLEGPIFQPLRKVAYFRRFFIDGGTISWPNGADIAPETLYEAAARERSNTTLKPTSGASSSKAKRAGRTRRSRLSV
jgi:hypothetical protein